MTRFALLAAALCCTPVFGQEDLLDLLGEEETGPVYTNASFKTTRVINGHSLENTAHGVLDFRISHRFGFLSGGVNEFFGLDNADVRLGLDYGVTDRLMVGIGRSGFQKTVDGFAKYKVLRQCDEGCGMPITLAVVASSSVTTARATEVPWYAPGRQDYFTHRLSYSWQMILGRKFSEGFTLQLSPGVVHRNLVEAENDPNDLINVGIGGRVKLTKRLAVNGEYFHVLRDEVPGLRNSLSVGFDIETGGHVFQLHFTNSTGMFERAFITETTGDWADGDVHFGFNISRVFTVHNPKKKRVE
ncbi:MAG: hypothetical protein H6590_04310 [Flavobacteriales bacterium]|nr:hypothetical protein [Flavobacteriales bacterium]MCB9178628.1 hypothetical protein [Flavobacteriales bacterium]HPF90770.1 DUF5777 family beta-barrel protein [Flavobacteriales bacterium]